MERMLTLRRNYRSFKLALCTTINRRQEGSNQQHYLWAVNCHGLCWAYYPHCLQEGSSCFPRKAATLLHKTSPFSHGHALQEQQFLLSCVKDGAWTSTSVPWMPNGWRQALESWSKVLMQQRGTGFCTYFCPQYFFLGSWAAHRRAPRSPGSRSGTPASPQDGRVHVPRMLLQDPRS